MNAIPKMEQQVYDFLLSLDFAQVFPYEDTDDYEDSPEYAYIRLHEAAQAMQQYAALEVAKVVKNYEARLADNESTVACSNHGFESKISELKSENESLKSRARELEEQNEQLRERIAF